MSDSQEKSQAGICSFARISIAYYFLDCCPFEETNMLRAYVNKALCAYLMGRKTARDIVGPIRWLYKQELDQVNLFARERELNEAEKERMTYSNEVLGKPDDFFVTIFEETKKSFEIMGNLTKQAAKAFADLEEGK